MRAVQIKLHLLLSLLYWFIYFFLPPSLILPLPAYRKSSSNFLIEIVWLLISI